MEQIYRRRVRAWTLYEWAGSGFSAILLGAVLPGYLGRWAGAAQPVALAGLATRSAALAIPLLLGAALLPLLGTVSDLARGKRLFLALFAALGALAVGLLALVRSGDTLLAALLFLLARFAFGCAHVFYDSLLPHVARPGDLDAVSARGYALGFLGGGLLLGANLLLVRLLPGTLGARLPFLSAAAWWALFSIPVLAAVPEPRTLGPGSAAGQGIWRETRRRLGSTLRDQDRRRELLRFLLAFLLYSLGISALLGGAATRLVDLDLGAAAPVLVLLVLQVAAAPFCLLFGCLTARQSTLRPVWLAFLLFTFALLPAFGILGTRLLPRALSGASPPPFRSVDGFRGEGFYAASDPALVYEGSWRTETAADRTGTAPADRLVRSGERAGDGVRFRFHGQELVLTCLAGPDFGVWNAALDGRPLDGPDGRPLLLSCYRPSLTLEAVFVLRTDTAGKHTLLLSNNGEKDTRSAGTRLALRSIRVQPARRLSSLPVLLGLILALEALFLGLAFLLGRRWFSGLAERLSTRLSLLLALAGLAVLAGYGLFADSVLHYAVLAWLGACGLGGSRALSRSLAASLLPAARSGEFFGLFGVAQNLAVLLGPPLFAGAFALLASFRAALLLPALLLAGGALLLLRLNEEQGRREARAEEERLAGGL